MYGKLFDSMYDGTLVDDWRALITFQQMIILCDADGVLDKTPETIARITNIPIEHIKAGIEILEKPDPNSRTPDQDGRRIVRMDDHRDWGWYLVNHGHYKELTDAITVRENNRIRKQQQRERERLASHNTSQDVTACTAMSLYTDTDTDNKNMAKMANPEKYPFDDFWSVAPKKTKKKRCQQIWKRLKDADRKSAIEDIQTRYTKTERKYIPDPSKYLNGEYWNDEREETQQEKPSGW